MRTKIMLILLPLMLIAAAGFYWTLFPGEAYEYWSPEPDLDKFRLSFWVHWSGGYCGWKVEKETIVNGVTVWAVADSGYLAHYEIRDEVTDPTRPVPLLQCFLTEPERLDARTSRLIPVEHTFLPFLSWGVR